jgi:O-antigen/teichoic acid export membrane protein
MVGSKIGSIIVRSTDNILLSAFLGLGIVGIYSNYLLIVTSITGILNKLLQSVTSGIGNLIITGNRERSVFVFKTHFLLNLFLVTITATCLAVSFTPFIAAWAGKSYVLPLTVTAVIVVNYFVDQIRQTAITFVSAYGLFVPNGKKSVVEAGMNLVLSLTLLVVFKMGIAGVLLGTILTDLLLNTWWEPWLIYRRGFDLDGFWKFFVSFYLKHAVFLFLIGGAVTAGVLYVDQFLPFGNLITAALNSIIAVVVLFPVICLFYYRHPSFKYLASLVKRFVKH